MSSPRVRLVTGNALDAITTSTEREKWAVLAALRGSQRRATTATQKATPTQVLAQFHARTDVSAKAILCAFQRVLGEPRG